MWKTGATNEPRLDKFHLLAQLDKNNMSHWIARTAIIVGISALAALPASAQDAAFDAETHNPTSPGMGKHQIQHSNQPISTAQGGEVKSNLKNWSRFSTSSNRPLFVRVPAGSQSSASSVSHYARPQHFEAGKAPVANTEHSTGPVKRYLAFNVPAGAFAKKNVVSPVKGSSTTSKNAVGSIPAAPGKRIVIKHAPTHVQILGYGHKSGEVTTSYLPISHHSARTTIACYPRYH